MKFVNHQNHWITPLMSAVCGQDIEMVKRLLSVKEIDVNKGYEDGMTPLHVACKYGYFEIARVKSFFHMYFLPFFLFTRNV